MATVYERETETGSCRHHVLQFKVMFRLLSFLEGFNGIIWFAISYRSSEKFLLQSLRVK